MFRNWWGIHKMDHKISADIIAFPGTPQPAEASAGRLPRALAALEAALAQQREAVAQWQASLGELRGSMAVLSGSVGRYQDSLTQLGTRVAGLEHANRRLLGTLNAAP
jgi:hypothetical protein